MENPGTKSSINSVDPRKRNDERALEKEEEDYFNEDRYMHDHEVSLVLFVSGFSR